MSVTSIPTNDGHNISFTDVSTTMLWPSSEYTMSKSLRLRSRLRSDLLIVYSDEGHSIVVETSVKELL